MSIVTSTDRAAKGLFRCLLSDFRLLLDDPNFCLQAEKAFEAGIPTYREYSYAEMGLVTADRYKARHQLASLLKKYSFQKDRYSDRERELKSIDAFVSHQARILPSMDGIINPILGRARAICREILGEFSNEEVCKAVKIGSRATIGGPMHNAYPDQKFGDVRAFTSSTSCSKWFFKDYLPGDDLLKQIVSGISKIGSSDTLELNLKHDTLSLVLVPKTWKIDRVITPLTLIGLFYTYGVGRVITDRLKSGANLDITRLQEKHREYAKLYSMTRSHATADLSRASDTIYLPLLRRLLPTNWYYAIKRGICRHVVWKGSKIACNSILPMGNGFTFPLQTLVFYSLIKAVGDIMGVRGRFSVYGDDLIYPSKLHSVIVYVFSRLGITHNLEKTYVSAHFRESCGGDFYRGYDVRPFLVPNENWSDDRRTNYLCFLYKCINGLLKRWEREEIPRTIAYLESEIRIIGGTVLQVPMTYADYSGLKVRKPLKDAGYSPVHAFCWDGCLHHVFDAIREIPKTKRKVRTGMNIYYWMALSGQLNVEEFNYRAENVRKTSHTLLQYIDRSFPPLPEPKIVYLRRYTTKSKVKVFYRGGKRYEKVLREKALMPFVDAISPPGYVIREDLVTDWI